jgi:Ca-activated chloride channel family protein
MTAAVSSISGDALQGRAAGVVIRGNSSRPYRSAGNFKAAPEFNTEGYSAIHENNFKSPLTEPLSTFSIDVDAASYSNVRRFISSRV